MIPALTISPQDWMAAPAAQAVMAALNRGQERAALFVGGCVRSAVAGEAVTDIDIATTLTPHNVMSILEAAAIKVIPTGIDHGTVTAVAGGVPFEITTLRRDVATDGRRAVVAFSTDWAEDAARRDFTMNTLLADEDGHIYDPLGAGLADLKAGRVVFVGDAAQRVAEDYLRILRFFRFHARYGRGVPDAAALAACAAGAGGIARLSRERVTAELLKILSVDNVVDTLNLMFKNGVLTVLPHHDYKPDMLNTLVKLQQEAGWTEALSRLALLAACDDAHLSGLSQHIVLPNESWRVLGVYTDAPPVVPGVREAKLWVYRHGAALARQLVCLGLARAGRVGITPDIDEILRSWEAPALPVNGDDVMKSGIARGPEVGRILHKIETWWIENDFAPDRDSCLRFIESAV